MLELVLLSQVVDALVDLLEGLIHDLGRQLFHRDVQAVGDGLHGLAGGVGVAVREVLRLHQAQHVGRAGVGDGDALAALQADDDIVGGVAGLRADQLDLRIDDLLLRRKDGVLAAGDVRGTRADVDDVAVVDTDHGTAGGAEDAHVQRVDVSGVAADDGVVNAGTAVLDNADVRGGAADLEVDGVRGAQIHQRAHDGGRGAGHGGQDGTLAHLADLHNAAVAAHDHQGHRDARGAHGALGGVGGGHHLGQDGRVDGRGAGAAGQAVQLGDVGGHRDGDALLLGAVVDHGLFRAAVDAERHGGDDDFRALALQAFDGGVDGLVTEGLFLDELVVHGDLAADLLVQDDVLQVQLRFGQPALEAAAGHADDADLRHVALDEGVGGLRGGVRHEHDVFGGDIVLAQAVLKALHNAGRNALLVIVGGFYLVFADDLVGQVVDGDGLGVGAANVNAHTDFSVLRHEFLLQFLHFWEPRQPLRRKNSEYGPYEYPPAYLHPSLYIKIVNNL